MASLAFLLIRGALAQPMTAAGTAATPQGRNRIDPALAECERGRGRHAETPGQMPLRGWKDILWRTAAEFSEDNILSVAAGVTFYSLLAIFPAIGAMISLYGLVADPGTVSAQLDDLAGFLPGGALDILDTELKRVAAQKTSSLGLGFFIGLGTALWSASAGIKAMFDALNIVYEERETRSFLRRASLALLFTGCGILFVILTLSAVVAVPVVLNFVGLSRMSALLALILRWPALFVVTAFVLSLLYRYGPSRRQARWRWISWGSTLAALLWVAASLLFSWYVQNFGNYDKTYGALGAVIGFMTWIWLSTTIFLLGGELNAEIEHQTLVDSTVGAPKPLGTRGATMADTIGKSAS
jgi:membrane protein